MVVVGTKNIRPCCKTTRRVLLDPRSTSLSSCFTQKPTNYFQEFCKQDLTAILLPFIQRPTVLFRYHSLIDLFLRNWSTPLYKLLSQMPPAHDQQHKSNTASYPPSPPTPQKDETQKWLFEKGEEAKWMKPERALFLLLWLKLSLICLLLPSKVSQLSVAAVGDCCESPRTCVEVFAWSFWILSTGLKAWILLCQFQVAARSASVKWTHHLHPCHRHRHLLCHLHQCLAGHCLRPCGNCHKHRQRDLGRCFSGEYLVPGHNYPEKVRDRRRRPFNYYLTREAILMNANWLCFCKWHCIVGKNSRESYSTILRLGLLEK